MNGNNLDFMNNECPDLNPKMFGIMYITKIDSISVKFKVNYHIKPLIHSEEGETKPVYDIRKEIEIKVDGKKMDDIGNAIYYLQDNNVPEDKVYGELYKKFLEINMILERFMKHTLGIAPLIKKD